MCDVRPDEFSAISHNRAMSRVQHRVIRLKREERAKGADVLCEVFEDGGALAEDGVNSIEGAVGGDVEADGVGGVPWGVDDLEEESVMERSRSCVRSWKKAPSAVGVRVPGGGDAIAAFKFASDGTGNLWMRGGLNAAVVFCASHILRRSERTE